MTYSVTKDHSIELPYFKLFQISLSQVAVSIGIVTFSAFIVAELRLMGMPSYAISIIFGLATFFELTRLYFGYLADRWGKTKKLIMLGSVSSIGGIFMVPWVLSLNSYLILVPLLIFNIGSSLVSTLIDTHLTSISTTRERGKVSGMIQFTRIMGFALGGVLGAKLYASADTEEGFLRFIYAMLVLVSILYLVSILAISDEDRLDTYTMRNSSSFFSAMKKLFSDIGSSKPMQFALLFLFFYPLSFFMQDAILEPYAIDLLQFTREGIGRITTISNILIFVFIPAGMFFERKIGRLQAYLLGQTIFVLGMAGFVLGSFIQANWIFYTSLIIFSTGAGMISAPSFAYLLDIAANYKDTVAVTLSIFGFLITIGRGIANILAGMILFWTNSYALVFGIELVFSILVGFLIVSIHNEVRIEPTGNGLTP